jgi:hypothetical protein
VPTVEAVGVAAGRIAEAVSTQTAVRLRIAGAGHDFLRHALLTVVLEGIVGIGGDLRIGQTAEIRTQRRRQASVGLRIEDILQTVLIAVGLAGGVVAGLQHVATTIRANKIFKGEKKSPGPSFSSTLREQGIRLDFSP